MLQLAGLALGGAESRSHSLNCNSAGVSPSIRAIGATRGTQRGRLRQVSTTRPTTAIVGRIDEKPNDETQNGKQQEK
jgi:hypothetical protein